MPQTTERKNEGGLRTKGYFKESHADMPLITIITVVYNNIKHIKETIQSVIKQTYNNIEYIIVDGYSTDGTVAIINSYSNEIDYWISEMDSGIYNAMNKAIRISRGDWIYFLGSDDCLFSNRLIENIIPYLKDDSLAVFGNVIYSNGNLFHSCLNLKTVLYNTIHHQSVFYAIKVFNDFKYDESFQIIADYELNLILYLNKLPVKQVDITIALCAHDGISRTLLSLAFVETNKVRGKLLGQLANLIVSIIYWVKFSAGITFRVIVQAPSRINCVEGKSDGAS